jgi:hypothetical protein
MEQIKTKPDIGCLRETLANVIICDSHGSNTIESKYFHTPKKLLIIRTEEK